MKTKNENRLMMMVVITDTVGSGCSALVVCLSENSAILAETNPELYEKVKSSLGYYKDIHI